MTHHLTHAAMRRQYGETDMTDTDDDTRDGILFRLWCKAASYPGGKPSRLIVLIEKNSPTQGNMQPKHYRAALMEYAKEEGINLP